MKRAVSSLVRTLFDDLAHGGSAEDLFRLTLELRLGHAHGEHRGHAGEDVVLLELVVADLEATGVLVDLRTQHLHEALLEALLVGAALGRRDDVDERARDGVVAGPPAQRDVDLALALDLGGHHRAGRLQHRHGLGEGARALQPPGVGHGGVGGEEVDELRDAAVVAVARLERLVGLPEPADGRSSRTTISSPGTRNAVCRARCASSSRLKAASFVKICRSAQYRMRVPVTPFAARPVDPQLGVRLERRERRVDGDAVGEHAGLAAMERHRPGLAAAVDLDVESLRQGVDDGCADAVQSARGGVRAAAELAAGVQLREDDLDAGEAGAGLDVDRDAARPVAHLDAAVGVQHDVDARAVAAEGLVDGVVDDLPQAVHEAAGVGRADVHSRAFADRLEPFEHLEVVGGILGGHNPQAYPRGDDGVGLTRSRRTRRYAHSEMSSVRGILETNAWLYFLPAPEFYRYEEAPR